MIKIEDIAWVRFTAPDLGVMQTFLTEFGLTHVPSEDGVLYVRGAGTSPFIHATAKGDAGFAALGLRAESLADLGSLANSEGVTVEPLAAPGGGRVIRLRDPDGRLVEVVAGQQPAAILSIRPDAEVRLVPIDAVQLAVFEASARKSASLGNLLAIAIEQTGEQAPLEPILHLIGAGALVNSDEP